MDVDDIKNDIIEMLENCTDDKILEIIYFILLDL